MSFSKITLVCCVCLLALAIAPLAATAIQNSDEKSKSTDITEKKDAVDKSAKQPQKSSGDTSDAGEDDFESLHKKWLEMDARFAELTENYKTESDAAKKAAIRKEYVELLGEAKKLTPALQKAAVKQFKESEGQDEVVTKLLIGMLVDKIATEKRDEAMDLADTLIAGGISAEMLVAMRDSDRLARDDMQVVDEIILRGEEAEKDDLPRVKLVTSKGDVIVELFENEAPGTVGNFISLVEKGFYDGLSFHRVLEDFMAQGGDPKGDGTGGPGYKIKDEHGKPESRNHFRGSLSMAHTSAPDSAGSQFFIVFNEDGSSSLNGGYTVFGRVISGMENVDKLKKRNPAVEADQKIKADKIIQAEIIRKRDHQYAPDKSSEGDD